MIMTLLEKGLPIITRAFTWTIVIQICHTITYTYYSIKDLDFMKLKNMSVEPAQLTIELLLELVLSATVFFAILKG